MAIIRYGEAMTDLGNPIDQIDLPSMSPTVATGTFASLTDKNGAVVNLTGSAFTYSLAGLTGGTLTGLEMIAPGGASLFSITGLNVLAADYVAGFLASGFVDISLLGDNDKVIGSSKADLMFAGGGNDRLFGGGGRDVMGGMDGRDQLTGGAGGDVFIFAKNTGVDRVMDFADSGGRADDFIGVKAAQYDAMQMTQEGADVLLDFGRLGKLLILDQTLAEMGADDFLVGALPF